VIARLKRQLEAERAKTALAEQKAALWKGATPSTRFDRLQAMERELAFLELANRLRDRLGDQRLALQQLKIRKQALAERLATMSEDAG
jgi:IS4 transposase